jgi:hypothetical protein
MGGEYVRLMREPLSWAVVVALADVGTQPAARKPGVFSIELLTFMRRSPIPSLIEERYDVRSCQIVKLEYEWLQVSFELVL